MKLFKFFTSIQKNQEKIINDLEKISNELKGTKLELTKLESEFYQEITKPRRLERERVAINELKEKQAKCPHTYKTKTYEHPCGRYYAMSPTIGYKIKCNQCGLILEDRQEKRLPNKVYYPELEGIS